jgi:hypothetical protein
MGTYSYNYTEYVEIFIYQIEKYVFQKVRLRRYVVPV